jgi:hypothetical protein
MRRSQTQSTAPANFMGVNGPGLWDIDLQSLVVPILHCPMGLVDKILETIKLWVNLDVEDLKDAANTLIRSDYKDAKDRHVAATLASQHAKALLEAHPTSSEAKELVSQTERSRKDAKKEETKQKKIYKEMIDQHNAKKTSLQQMFEDVYRKHGVKR